MDFHKLNDIVRRLLSRHDNLIAKGEVARQSFSDSYLNLLSFQYKNSEKNWNVVIDIIKYLITIQSGIIASTFFVESIKLNRVQFILLNILYIFILVLLLLMRSRYLKELESQITHALEDRFHWAKDELDKSTSEFRDLTKEMENTSEILRQNTADLNKVK